MKITWTKCSERMPPDSLVDRFIFTNLYHACAESLIYTGHTVNMLGIIDGDAWTPYTEEAWAELNRTGSAVTGCGINHQRASREAS